MSSRREFITLLGAAIAWPLLARAQQPTMPVIGFLGPALNTRQHWFTAFRRGLGTEGFIERQNVIIEYRSADSGVAELQELAAELIRRQVAVIFALGPPAALVAKRSTQTIPIVFVSGGDPVQMGLVSSFHRPDGNVTGFYFLSTGLVAKRLALLHELLPRAERVAVLVNPTNAATAEPTARDVAVAGRALNLDIQVACQSRLTSNQGCFWLQRPPHCLQRPALSPSRAFGPISQFWPSS
jgi:putative tryptophan/tyrosine transport system substrate-binding protein